jgi:hypothetical protein
LIEQPASVSLKIALPIFQKFMFSLHASRAHGGRFAVVTTVGCGMRWTRRSRETSETGADGEIVWSWRPDAGVKSCEDVS